MTCRYCGKEIEGASATTFAYWSATPFPCHPACKESGEKQEALDCQIIDADCNDCRHYKRGKLAGSIVSNVTRPDGTVVEIGHKPNIFIGGTCLKFNKPTVAQPNKWTGHECFEHRRAHGLIDQNAAADSAVTS